MRANAAYGRMIASVCPPVLASVKVMLGFMLTSEVCIVLLMI